jgi:hypothetical protein
VLANALREANRKPRSRAEWEARFVFWQRPASETEEAQIASAASRIRRAMGHSRDLAERSWTIIEQGSYRNNTNTRAESDMDLCVCLTDAFFADGPPGEVPTLAELGRVTLTFTFDQYRAHIAWCLGQEFGSGAVTLGNKAIHLHKDDSERIHADIVPELQHACLYLRTVQHRPSDGSLNRGPAAPLPRVREVQRHFSRRGFHRPGYIRSGSREPAGISACHGCAGHGRHLADSGPDASLT